MDKVNEFEHGIDNVTKTRFDSLYFGTLSVSRRLTKYRRRPGGSKGHDTDVL